MRGMTREEYAIAEAFWLRQWERIPQATRAGWRTPWFPNKFETSGNPIFTAVSRRQRRAIRLIESPKGDGLDFDFWFDSAGEGDEAVRELVIEARHTSWRVEMAGYLWTAWLQGAWPKDNVRR